MKKKLGISLSIVMVVAIFALTACSRQTPAAAPTVTYDAEQKFADIGDFELVSGEVIKDCQIGYRTYGTMNADKSNVILWLPWLEGKSSLIADFYVGEGNILDPDKYFIVIPDPIGNGVSTSPSNSTAQPGDKFPKFNIRDMIDAEYILLVDKLGINSVECVMGLSMGGIQTYEWMVAYPDFMEKAVPIMGSPQMTSYDLLHWDTMCKTIDMAKKDGIPSENRDALRAAFAGGLELHNCTPDYRINATTPDQYADFIASAVENDLQNFQPLDWEVQIQAMMQMDVAKEFGSMEDAAALVEADVLIFHSSRDLMVNSSTAETFGKLINAQIVTWDDNGGHHSAFYINSDSAELASGIQEFLETD
jgi:homoserine O-acetyltransferase